MALMVVLLACSSASAEQGLLFHADFQSDSTARHAMGDAEPVWARRVQMTEGRLGQGVLLPRGARFAFDGPGNAQAKAGTMTFYWRMTEEAPDGSFVIADLTPLQKVNYRRWMRLSYAYDMLELYFTPASAPGSRSRAAVALTTPQLQHQIEPGRWYHMAIAWDESRGVGLYLDGQLVASHEKPWYFGGQVARFGLGIRPGVDRPSSVTHEQAFDEVRIYDRWLSEEALVELAGGEVPQLPARDDRALLDQRRAMFSHETPMPVATVGSQGGASGLRQVGIRTAQDVKRTNWAVFDGERSTRWPGRVGYSDAARELDVYLEADESVDVLQLFGRGPITVVDVSDESAIFDRTLLSSDQEQLGHARAVLDEPVTTEHLALRRGGVVAYEREGEAYPLAPPGRPGGGMAYTLGLFKRTAYDVEAEGWKRLALTDAELDADADERATVRKLYSQLDQRIVLAGGQAAEGQLHLPGLRMVHLLGPVTEQRCGVAAMALDLHVVEASLPGWVRVEIIDPITHERQLVTADWRLEGESPGRLRIMLDMRDLVLPAGGRPWLALTFSDDVVLDASASAILLREVSVEQAVAEHSFEQLRRFGELFQELSESRPWGWKSRHVDFLRRVSDDLLALNEGDPLIEGYWHWIRPNEPKPRTTLPEVPEGTPAWAVYIDALRPQLKQVAYWWIDHRMSELGEFGANDGINDDTVLVQDWWALHLLDGPDEKLMRAARRVADRSWQATMEDGLSRPITDALHMYEWGVNAQSLMAAMDYGNPVYLSRLMATARQYERLTRMDDEGRRKFRSWYFGSRYIDDELRGNDRAMNALAMQPAMLLGWYNADAYATRVLTEWTEAMMHDGGTGHGFQSALWASYALSGEQHFLDYLGEATERRHDRYLAETGDDDDALYEALVEQTEDPRVWEVSLHNNRYRALKSFYHRWQIDRDVSVIEEGLKLSLQAMDWAMPMLTEAEQSTDRVWLPLGLINRVVLGGQPIVRNELYPEHAVSWENATGRVIPFVHRASTDELQLWLHNLDDEAADIDMRLWRLAHGRYLVQQGLDQANDMAFDDEPERQETVLARHDVMPLTIPPNSTWLVRIEQQQALDDIRHRPDLAVAADDALYNYDRSQMVFQVYNLGARPTGAFNLRVRVGDTVLIDRQMSSLEPPTDQQPRRVGVMVRNLKPHDSMPVTIELDPAGEIDEITRANNTLTVVPTDLPGHDTLR